MLTIIKLIRSWIAGFFRASSFVARKAAKPRARAASFPGGLFSLPGGPALRPKVGPAKGVGRPRKPAVAPEGVPDPKIEVSLRRMRRAAVFDIFDRLKLDIVPALVWSYTDGSDDIADGLSAFFSQVGLDAQKLKAGDPEAVARANELLILLMDVGSAFIRLPDTVKAQIEARLRSGDYEVVREAAYAVSTFERISQASEIWPADQRFAVFDAFIAKVKNDAEDPLSKGRKYISDTDAYFNKIMELMGEFDNSRREYRRIVRDIEVNWPDHWESGPEFARRNHDMTFFEVIENGLLTDGSLDLDHIADALVNLEDCLRKLEALLEAARGERRAASGGASGKGHGGKKSSGSDHDARGRAGGGDPGAPSGPSPREQALECLGFPKGSHPDAEEINRAWKELNKKLSLNGLDPSSAEYKENEKKLKNINASHDFLIKGW